MLTINCGGGREFIYYEYQKESNVIISMQESYNCCPVCEENKRVVKETVVWFLMKRYKKESCNAAQRKVVNERHN